MLDNCIKTSFDKKFLHSPRTLTVEKKELFIVIPYLRNLSLALRTHLQNSINKIFLIVRSRLFLCPRHVLVIFSVLKIKSFLNYSLM